MTVESREVRSTGLKSYLEQIYQSILIIGHRSDKKELQDGVPQGPVLGSVMFTTYTPITKVFTYHGVDTELYADDTQLYLSFKPRAASSKTDAVFLIEGCTHDIKSWMDSYYLKN